MVRARIRSRSASPTSGRATAETSFTITVTEGNAPPVLAAIGNQSVAEGSPVTVTASATDADLPAQTLTYSLVTAPMGATIGATTGVFTWTPGEADGPGTHPVTIRVTDSGGATAETSFTITVTEGNAAPVLAAIGNQSVAEGAPVAVTASATDADLPAQTLTYSLVTAPMGATIGATTGAFAWTPGEADGPGTHPVTIRVTDSGGATAETSFTITVTEGNARAGAGGDQQSVSGGRIARRRDGERDRCRPAGADADLQPGDRADGRDDRGDDGCVRVDAGRSRRPGHASGDDPRHRQRRCDRGDQLHDHRHRGQCARRCWPRSAISRWRRERPSP